MRPFEPEFEKPYDFVPFPGQAQQAMPHGHHLYTGDRLSGTLELALEVRRPVQVASGFVDFVRGGQSEELAALAASVPRRDPPDAPARPVPVLPGSSLKGAVRNVVEAISPSCVRVADRRARQVLPQRALGCRDGRRLCPACRLFGMAWDRRNNYQGQVAVLDALAPRDSLAVVHTPLLWTPARGRELPSRYLDGHGQARGRKFYYHGQTAGGPDARCALRPGTTLAAHLQVENLSAPDMGLLVTALGLHPQYPLDLHLGGGKPAGLGTVGVTAARLRLRGDLRQTGRLGGGPVLEGNELAGRIREWTAACAGLLQTEALVRLRELQADPEREMPSGPY
jgi:CRISPR/Cas system CSM-associated protein Csm3 (group 7 of RAMP superfamily)